jgi:uncharacterized protein
MAMIISHLLAAYAVLIAPSLSCVLYQRARKRLLAGDRLAKVRFYRSGVVEQVVTTALVLALWLWGGIPRVALGIRAPYSWLWTASVLVVLVTILLWSGAKLRPKAEKIRKRFQDSLGMLFSESHQERLWFGTLSVGAGISEELVYRGFLMWYLGEYVPHINTTEKILLTSIAFGLGHVYQGWKQAIPTGIGGAVLALLYVFSGSLLLPAVVHAASDWRMLLILPPRESDAAPVESVA